MPRIIWNPCADCEPCHSPTWCCRAIPVPTRLLRAPRSRKTVGTRYSTTASERWIDWSPDSRRMEPASWTAFPSRCCRTSSTWVISRAGRFTASSLRRTCSWSVMRIDEGLVGFVESRLDQLGREPAEPLAVLLTSADPDRLAGLKEIVERYHPRLFVAPEALELLRKSLSAGQDVYSTAELPARGGFRSRRSRSGGEDSRRRPTRSSGEGKSCCFPGGFPSRSRPGHCPAS